MLDFSSKRQGFGADLAHLARRLNPFLGEAHDRLRRLALEVVTYRTPEPEEHFAATGEDGLGWIGRRRRNRSSRPIVFMSVEEICDTHR